MRRTYRHQLRWLILFSATAVTACVEDIPEDGAGGGSDESEHDIAASSVRSPCAACSPPFVERLGEVMFSGELIVRPVQGAAPERDRRARDRIAPDVVKHYPEVDEYVVRAPAGASRGDGENRVAAALMATGDYEYAVPNWLVAPTAVPNDPLYGGQWHHPKIQAPQAWDLQQGSGAMILAFTDTGIDVNHPDLAPRRVPGFNAVTDLAESSGGDVSDIHGHGTHVAGCAAAIGNNGLGVSGVGWKFKLMMVRVSQLTTGNATMDNILQGARWAADHGAKVVSTSYGGVDLPSVQTTGAYLKARDVLYVYAAGNDGRNLTAFDHADVIVVGASDSMDQRAGFSAYGPAIDVFAPGVNIRSTRMAGGYGAMSGTSMAAPIVNGVAGLIWSVNPRFTPWQVEGFLFSSANDLGGAGNDAVFGWGRVNAWQGVSTARAVACTHDRCAQGAPLGSGCDPCIASICAADSHCCGTSWDAACVDAVTAVCGLSCS